MHNKPVAIIGAGNGGQAYAGWLALRGYTTRIYNARPGTVKALEKAGAIEIQGNADHTGIGKFELVSTRIDEVIRGCEVINVIMPSNLHLMIADTLAPYLEDGQTIILTPAAPFGAISFRHRLKEAGCEADVTIAQTSTLLFACRLVEHGKVYVNGQKDRLSISAVPQNRNEKIKPLMAELFPAYEFVNNISTVSFENINFEFHPGPTLLYTAMIEKGIPFEYYIDFVPSQVKLIQAIDEERMAIAPLLHADVSNATETFRSMYPYEGDLYEMVTNADCYKGIKGPTSLQVRYLTEDVPYALKVMQMLGKIVGVPTPVIDSVITLAYTLVGREVMGAGVTLGDFGFNGNTRLDDVLDAIYTGEGQDK